MFTRSGTHTVDTFHPLVYGPELGQAEAKNPELQPVPPWGRGLSTWAFLLCFPGTLAGARTGVQHGMMACPPSQDPCPPLYILTQQQTAMPQHSAPVTARWPQTSRNTAVGRLDGRRGWVGFSRGHLQAVWSQRLPVLPPRSCLCYMQKGA